MSWLGAKIHLDLSRGHTRPLTTPQLAAFESLVSVSEQLESSGPAVDASVLREAGARVLHGAYLLAGLGEETELPVGERIVVVMRPEQQASGGWSCRVDAPREAVTIHSTDGQSRSSAIVTGLILLVQTLLDRESLLGRRPQTTAESVLLDALDEALTSYEGNLESVAEAEREPCDDVESFEQLIGVGPVDGLGDLEPEPEASFHGDGGVD